MNPDKIGISYEEVELFNNLADNLKNVDENFIDWQYHGE